MQRIARYRREIADSSTSAGRRSYLERWVQHYESTIQRYELKLAQTDAELASTAAALLPQGKFT